VFITRIGVVTRVQIQLTKKATHKLEIQGQAPSAGFKFSSTRRPLTNWITDNRCCQQGPKPAHHGSHSLSGEPRIGVVGGAQIQFETMATHFLDRSVNRVQIQQGVTHDLESQ